MVIEICSQKRALEQVPDPRYDTSVISIVSSDERDVDFGDAARDIEILRLRFNDLKAEYDEDGIPYGRPLPKQSDFDGLRAFTEKLGCDRLIVHCWEGTSRSAAVAAAVYEFRECRDTMYSHSRFSPNTLVYSLACRELGIRRSAPFYRVVPEGEDTWEISRSL